jgi:7-cyano-7-deazaguanine synthase
MNEQVRSDREPLVREPLCVVALVSGGIESAVLVKELLAAGHTVIPCYVEAGLCWEASERRALEGLLEALAHERLEDLVVLSMPVADCYRDHWSLTGAAVPDAASPDGAVELPGRNLLLLAKAAVYAADRGAEAVALGSLKGNPFPDATAAFFAAMEEAASQAMGRPMAVMTPLAHLDKAEVLRRAGPIPLDRTFSCIAPLDGLHCGRCNKCAERRRGFAQAGLADPTPYAVSPPVKEPTA